jgi:hypothetical protein
MGTRSISRAVVALGVSAMLAIPAGTVLGAELGPPPALPSESAQQGQPQPLGPRACSEQTSAFATPCRPFASPPSAEERAEAAAAGAAETSQNVQGTTAATVEQRPIETTNPAED